MRPILSPTLRIDRLLRQEHHRTMQDLVTKVKSVGGDKIAASYSKVFSTNTLRADDYTNAVDDALADVPDSHALLSKLKGMQVAAARITGKRTSRYIARVGDETSQLHATLDGMATDLDPATPEAQQEYTSWVTRFKQLGGAGIRGLLDVADRQDRKRLAFNSISTVTGAAGMGIGSSMLMEELIGKVNENTGERQRNWKRAFVGATVSAAGAVITGLSLANISEVMGTLRTRQEQRVHSL